MENLPKNNDKCNLQVVNKTQVNTVEPAMVNNVAVKQDVKSVQNVKPKGNKVIKGNSICKNPKTVTKKVIEQPQVVSRQGVSPLLAAVHHQAPNGLGAQRSVDDRDVTPWPPRRELPVMPVGNITQ